MNSSYVQQLTNPELQTQDSTQKINFFQQWFKQQNEMEHSGQRGSPSILMPPNNAKFSSSCFHVTYSGLWWVNCSVAIKYFFSTYW